MEQLEQIPQRVTGPVLINVAPKTPYLHVKEYEAMGYDMAIYPPLSITTAYTAIKQKLEELKTDGINKDGGHGGVSFDELTNFLGLNYYRGLEEEFLKDLDLNAEHVGSGLEH